jgi:hypothetical protein
MTSNQHFYISVRLVIFKLTEVDKSLRRDKTINWCYELTPFNSPTTFRIVQLLMFSRKVSLKNAQYVLQFSPHFAIFASRK